MTGENLLRLLEMRLDNVVYRMGFASSRAQARQLVTHGHFSVNGRPTNVPSFGTKVGDRIEVRDSRRGREYFKVAGETIKAAQIPEWVSVDPAKLSGLGARRTGARADAARVQRAARRRVLLALGVTFHRMIELETPQQQQQAPEPAHRRGARGGQPVPLRGDPAPGGLRRHAGQRPAPRAPQLPRGSRRHQHPDQRRLPRVQHDRERQGRRHPDRPEREEAPPPLVRAPRADAEAHRSAAPAR